MNLNHTHLTLRRFLIVVKMRNILFYFPYRGFGGVPVLFKRVASYLAAYENVYLIDFNDGAMSDTIPKGVEFISYSDKSNYPLNSTLILQSTPLWNIKHLERFHPSTKVFFWNLHPLNLYPYIFSSYSHNYFKRLVAGVLMPLSFYRKRKLIKLLKYLIDKNAIVFMDKENHKKTSEFYSQLEIPKRLLPIVYEPKSVLKLNDDRSLMRCCWVGRIVDFKVHILIHLIERLDEVAKKIGKVEMFIIGDGDSIDFLKLQTNHLQNVNLIFIPNISTNDLGGFLTNNVDALFAMGTSALEGASRSIPTILLHYSYIPITGLYKFNYIFNTEEYSLGDEFDANVHTESSSSLEDILIDIKYNKKHLGQQCLKYCCENFSPESVSRSLAEMVNSSSAILGDLRDMGLFKPDLISLVIKKILRVTKKNTNLTGFYEN